ncbi:hypothetical protein [Streptomyces thermodiastaticus]|uniref:hypothetical protein n=1 Tax=Streptomyces thermodiastaticus TaxID=44061 RepID=UPI0019AF32C3|nr:hypothetical protein [Streptomyces thermodiastaticus]MCE7550182.1 hypothetical protein [Streptomyces thermodiastaticus]GHF68016.1 hypothetical protein GCM10018787_15570 [Streptomyces thermodiastaticus]
MTNGGGRYWNEDAQRWEDGTRDDRVTMPRAPRPGGRRPRALWAVAGATAVVGLAVGLTVSLGTDDDGRNPEPTGSPTLAVPTLPPPEDPGLSDGPGTDSGTPTPTSTEPPYGYAVHDDAEGFRIAVPDGWYRSTTPSQHGMDVVNYRSAAGDRRIMVFEVEEATPDESFEKYLSQVPKPRGFHQLSLEHVDDAGVSGTRLEYTADSLRGEPDIGTWHIYDERFVSVDGLVYAIVSYGPDSDGGADALRNLTTALEWFCPPGSECPVPSG